MFISMIVAMDNMGGIGKNGNIPWKFKEDMALFKWSTRKGIVIMGRKTYESIPKYCKLFERCQVIVLSRNEKNESAIYYTMETCMKHLKDDTSEDIDIMVIGGSQIYTLFMDAGLIDHVCVTHINESFECTEFMDEYNLAYFENSRGWTRLTTDSFSFNLAEHAARIRESTKYDAIYVEFIKNDL